MEHLTEEQLNEYLDGLLDEQTHQRVEAHLVGCAECRSLAKNLELVFASLDNLPEVPLAHNLAPSVLANLPPKTPVRIWTRAFAAQWGIVVGTLVWLGSQLIPLVRIPQVALPKVPNIDLETLLTRLLIIRFSMPDSRFAAIKYQLPQLHFQLPALNPSTVFKLSLQPSTAHIAALMISALLLWVLGNVILLRKEQEASS